MTDYLLNALVTLFVILDPIAIAPLFLVVTEGLTPGERRRAANLACITAGSVLVVFALVGEPLIKFLGISLPAFRVAGGLLLFWIAFEMVFDRRQKRKAGTVATPSQPPALDDAGKVTEDVSQVGVFPVGIPLIAGPGAISATILISSRATGAFHIAGLIAIILLLIAASYVALIQAYRIDRLLGITGRVVVTRLLGILLAALAVQFIADGARAFIAEPVPITAPA